MGGLPFYSRLMSNMYLSVPIHEMITEWDYQSAESPIVYIIHPIVSLLSVPF